MLNNVFKGAGEQLAAAALVIRERNETYRDSVNPHAMVMAALYPNGVTLNTPEEFARFSLVNMVAIKLTRYCSSAQGQSDSLTDAISYLAALAEVDRQIARDGS